MAIEPIFEKISLSGRKQVFGESVKTECSLPIASDVVSEVLSVSAMAVVLNGEVKDGQINYGGRAVLYICYLSTDGELKKTECSADFVGDIKDGGIKAGQKANCYIDVVKTDFNLTGTNLAVALTIKASADLTYTNQLSALSGGENIIIDTCDYTLSKSYGVREGVYPLEEEFEVASEIKEVLYHRASANIVAVQCGVGSIIVDGQVYLSVIALQKSQKSSIIKETRTAPFRMEIDYEDAMPTMWATASVIEKGLKTEVLVDEESGKSKVTVGLNLHFTGEAWTSEERTIARDAFSTTDLLEIIKEQYECYKPCEFACLNWSFNGRASTPELPVSVTMFAVACEKAEVLSSEYNGGKLKISGVITAVGYFADGEGKPFSRKLETTFDKQIDCNISGEFESVSVKVERTNARLISATEIELDGELIVCVRAVERVSVNCIKDIKQVGEKQENPHAISVYIPMENEELWSLAKRLNVCPEALVETNPDLTFPLTGEERIVVYRKI